MGWIFLKILLKLALRNIALKKIRFFLLFLTFVLSTLTVMTAVFFKDAAIHSRQEQLRNKTLNSQIVIRASNDKDFYFSSADVLDKIKNIKDIEKTIERCGGSAQYKDMQLNVVGVDFEKQAKVYSFNYVEFINIPAYENKIIVSEGFSIENGLNLGDVISLSTNNKEMKFKITGIAENKGIFQSNNIVFIKIQNAQELFDKKGLVYTIGITIKRLENVSYVVSSLKEVVGSKYEVEQSYDIESYRAYVGTISMALGIFSAFAIFITIFLTYSSFRTILYERISQIGTLRSIGTSKLQIFITTYIENFILVVFSTIIGLFVSFPLLKYILKIITESEVRISFSVIKIILIFLVLLFTGLISVLLSIIKILKIPIVTVIKGGMTKQTRNNKLLKHLTGFILLILSLVLLISSEYVNNSIYYLIAGIILISMAFILLTEILHLIICNTALRMLNLMGSGSKLLNKEFKRDFSKSAESIVLISIVIGIAYLSFTLSFLVKNSVDEVYKGVDIIINTDANTEIINEELLVVSGVDLVISQLRTNMNIKQMDVEISGVMPIEYKDFSFEVFKKGSRDKAFQELESGKNIIITNTFAKNTNTNIGDYIEIGEEVKYKVIAIVSSFENMGKVLFISKDNFKKDIVHNKYTLYFIKAEAGYSVNQIQNDIHNLLDKKYNYNMNSLEKMKEENEQANNKLFMIVNSLFLISIVISIFSLNNNLIINVLTRIKVFAIKRTVGMSLKQIMINILGEGAIIGLEGGILGIIFGFSLNIFLVRILSLYVGDLTLGYNYFSYIFLLVSSIMIGFISSVYPYYKIKKIDIVQAIKGLE